jgi:hypothetical protein
MRKRKESFKSLYMDSLLNYRTRCIPLRFFMLKRIENKTAKLAPNFDALKRITGF